MYMHTATEHCEFKYLHMRTEAFIHLQRFNYHIIRVIKTATHNELTCNDSDSISQSEEDF